MAWEYQRNDSKGGFKPIPAGKHRVRIKSAEMAKAKNTGRDMISMQLEVSGYAGLLFHNIVLNPDNKDMTNRLLTQFFDSFTAIPDGSFEFGAWVGKVGACVVKHEEYNGNMQAKVHYFIKPEEAASLPAWVEPPKKEDGETASASDTGFVSVPEGSGDSLPFF